MSDITVERYFVFPGKSLRYVASSNEEDVDTAVRSARREFKAWKKFSGFERGNVLKKAANIIRVFNIHFKI